MLLAVIQAHSQTHGCRIHGKLAGLLAQPGWSSVPMSGILYMLLYVQ